MEYGLYKHETSKFCKMKINEKMVNTTWDNLKNKMVVTGDTLHIIYLGKGDLYVSDIIRKIGRSCFKGARYDLINLPDTIEEIDDDAFSNCFNLLTVRLGSGLKQLGKRAFKQCYALEGIYLPYGLTEIKDETFCNCENIKKVVMQDGVVNIGIGTFKCCENLNNVVLSANIEYIERHAFEDCVSLENVDFPESVVSIGTKAFGGCVNLKTVKIKNTIKEIKKYAFIDCPSLKEIYFDGTILEFSKMCRKDAFEPFHNIICTNGVIKFDSLSF